MLELTKDEYQKLTLMLGSKKALGQYLGLDNKQLDELWQKMELMAPLTWIRAQPRPVQLELLAQEGSLKKLAIRLGCSEGALRPIYMGEPVRELDWELDFLLEQFERYRSVRLVAYIHKVSESLVRRLVEKFELEIPDLIDYSFGANSNSKGRRAELEFQRLRGENVIADRNKIDGSQAEYDFDDQLLGKVNVKSSRQYKFKAQTRKGNPLFWKFSSAGWAAADKLVCMCYDEKMTELKGVYVIDAKQAAHSKTITITALEMLSPDVLRSGPVAI